MKYPTKKLHKIIGTKPLLITMAERRWKLLGRTLKLPADSPARKVIRYYYEGRTNNIFRGRRKTTTESTLMKTSSIQKKMTSLFQ